jgi:cytochrome c oxidase subunit IV
VDFPVHRDLSGVENKMAKRTSKSTGSTKSSGSTKSPRATRAKKATTVPPGEGETPSSPNESLEEVQAKSVRDVRAVPLENIPEEQIPEEIQEIRDAESDEAREARRAVEVELNKPIEAIEAAVESLDEQPSQAEVAAHIAHHEDTPVVFMGRTFNTNIYTFVFGILGAITIFEIIVAEILPEGIIRTLLLVIPSIGKALLVMAFYMHLREDNRIFAAAVALPAFIGIVSALFLLAVPTSGYSY